MSGGGLRWSLSREPDNPPQMRSNRELMHWHAPYLATWLPVEVFAPAPSSRSATLVSSQCRYAEARPREWEVNAEPNPFSRQSLSPRPGDAVLVLRDGFDIALTDEPLD